MSEKEREGGRGQEGGRGDGGRDGGSKSMCVCERERESMRALHLLQKLIDLVVRLALIQNHCILIAPRLHLASLIIDILF